MTAAAENPKPKLLSESLHSVHVDLRADLETTRHLFRGAVSYIIRDPMTFQSQRLSDEDYAIFVHIRSDKTLGDIFDELVEQSSLDVEDKEYFYQFVLSLHGVGFLHLPVSDDKALYERYRRRKEAARRGRWMSILYFRIPIWNPNAFLDRTVHLVRPLFSIYALFVWIALLTAAGIVAVSRWQDLWQPVHGVLLARNLPLLAITLIVLKVFHEFGHAYACKHFGGHVPEMGAVLIMFTPCAYVDATGSLSFTSTRHRVVVCLAGMYVESIFAAIALLVWATTESSMINAVAYNVMFLAGVVTVAFNINPLMRYDGYYVLCDLVEIPNLRQRSTRYVQGCLKRIFLGIQNTIEVGNKRARAIMLTYGVSVSIYRALVMITIAAVLAYKMRTLGLIVGIGFVVKAVIGLVRSITRYLWHHEETAHVRWRAVSLGLLLVLVLPAGIFWLPLPSTVNAAATIVPETEIVLRAENAGFLTDVFVNPGDLLQTGDPIATLDNDARREDFAAAQATLNLTLLRRDAFRIHDTSRAQQEQSKATAYRAALLEQEKELQSMQTHSPVDAVVVDCLRDTSLGMFVPHGQAIARLAAGGWRARVIITEDAFRRARPHVGQNVEFRSVARPARSIPGRVIALLPAASRQIDTPRLTHLGGGDIAVDPRTQEATQPYVEVRIAIDEPQDACLHNGMTGFVRLASGAESIGHAATRRFVRFWNRLVQEQ